SRSRLSPHSGTRAPYWILTSEPTQLKSHPLRTHFRATAFLSEPSRQDCKSPNRCEFLWVRRPHAPGLRGPRRTQQRGLPAQLAIRQIASVSSSKDAAKSQGNLDEERALSEEKKDAEGQCDGPPCD